MAADAGGRALSVPGRAKTAEGAAARAGDPTGPVRVVPGHAAPGPDVGLGKRLVVALGMAWTLPNTVIGLLLGAVGMAFGARPRLRRRDLACVFHRWPWGPGGAITIGNVILHTGSDLDTACSTYAHAAGLSRDPPIRLCDHERAHVYQYLVLGPLFLPAYLVCGGVSVRNPFERAADRYASTGHGWWPWPVPPRP